MSLPLTTTTRTHPRWLSDTPFIAPTVPHSTAQRGGTYSLDPDRARIRTASTQASVSAKSFTSSFKWCSAAASL